MQTLLRPAFLNQWDFAGKVVETFGLEPKKLTDTHTHIIMQKLSLRDNERLAEIFDD